MDKNNKVDLRTRIIKSAQKLFVDKGYHSTSIPDIIKAAEVSTGALYHHFASKEMLARFIQDQAVEQFCLSYDSQVRVKKSTQDKIKAYVEMMFNWTEEDPEMVEYLLYGRPKEILERCLSVCSQEGLEGVMEIVQDGLKQKVLSQKNEYLLAACISGIMIRLIDLRIDGIIEFPLNKLTESTTDSIWTAIKA